MYGNSFPITKTIQLNAFEKILLARKGPAQASSMARYVRDKWELIAPDPEKFDRLFDVALKTSALKGEETEELAVLESLQSDEREMIVGNSQFLQGREVARSANQSAYSFSGGVPPAAPPPPGKTAGFSDASSPSPFLAKRAQKVAEEALSKLHELLDPCQLNSSKWMI